MLPPLSRAAIDRRMRWAAIVADIARVRDEFGQKAADWVLSTRHGIELEDVGIYKSLLTGLPTSPNDRATFARSMRDVITGTRRRPHLKRGRA